MKAVLFISALALALAGCGGDGGGDDPPGKSSFDEAAPASVAISHDPSEPISHTFTEAGTYTLTATGAFTATSVAPSDALRVWFSFSGQGNLIAGDAEPTYTLSTNGQTVQVQQSVTVTLTGAGPWQLIMLCQAAETSTGTLTDLKLHGVEN